MRLATALAIAAAPGGVAAFAVPLLPVRGRSSVDAPTVPDLRRTDGTGASIEGGRDPVRDPVREHGREVVRVVVVGTTTRTEFETVLTTSTVTPTTTPPPTTTTSRSCDLRYCDAGTSYCEYWGGYSSFDVSEGRPIPGETRTPIGVCTGVTPILGSHTSQIVLSSVTSSSTSSTRANSTTTSTNRDPLDTLTCTSTIQSEA